MKIIAYLFTAYFIVSAVLCITSPPSGNTTFVEFLIRKLVGQ